ncbi:MAG: glycosyltransferase, partial [Prochlorothrix sp.]
MVAMPRQSIAFFSLAADPAGDLEAGKTRPEVYYLRQLGEALATLGWQVDLFTAQRSPRQPTQVQHGEYCRTVRLPGLTAQSLRLLTKTVNPPVWSQFQAAFYTFQAKEGANYPVIHTSDWISGQWGLQWKQTSHGQWVHTAYGTVGAGVPVAEPAVESAVESAAGHQARQAVERHIWAEADRVVVTVPPENQPSLWPVSAEGVRSDLEVIPCGTDTQHFQALPQTEARQALGFDVDTKILLYVGQFAPHKGLETLIDAAAQLAAAGVAFQLVLAGEEVRQGLQERSRVEQLIADRGLADRTQFPGYISHDPLPTYYSAADVCVIPSYYEPFGWVAIEAMACGTPVVASQVGGLALTIAHEATGLLVPPRDGVALAQAIQRVLENPTWAASLRQSSTDRAAQLFSWSRVAAQFSDLYRRLL